MYATSPAYEAYKAALVHLQQRAYFAKEIQQAALESWQEAKGAAGTLEAWTEAINDAVQAEAAVYHIRAAMEEEATSLEQMMQDQANDNPTGYVVSVTMGHPAQAGAGYDCNCGECLYDRSREAEQEG